MKDIGISKVTELGMKNKKTVFSAVFYIVYNIIQCSKLQHNTTEYDIKLRNITSYEYNIT